MEKNGFLLKDKRLMFLHEALLPAALEIINRFEEHPQWKDKDRVLPVLSNQKMNSYLKEIADACGINKNLTYHIARHTFATTVTLSRGCCLSHLKDDNDIFVALPFQD